MSIPVYSISPLINSGCTDFDPSSDLEGALSFWGKQDFTITAAPDIDTWLDQSTPNYNASQGVALDKPHEVAGIINGFNVARYDGVRQYLDSGRTYQSECKDQLGYGFVVQAQDGQPAADEVYVGHVNAAGEDRGIYAYVDVAGKINIQYEANNILTIWKAKDALPNGAKKFGLVVWIDKAGGFIKVGYSEGSAFTELDNDGVNQGSLAAIDPNNFAIVDNPYWGARNNAGVADSFAQIDVAEGFIQSGMTQNDFENWGVRFCNEYGL